MGKEFLPARHFFCPVWAASGLNGGEEKLGRRIAMMKSRGEIEAEVRRAVTRFKKDYLGRGPTETRVYLLDEMIVIRDKGVLTPAERLLLQAGGDDQARRLIGQLHREMLERHQQVLRTALTAVLGVEVQSVLTDLSTESDESVCIFTLRGPLANGAVRNGP
jgi:uncharacterized protein YbcI